jgi:hypothetical protein
VKENCFSFASKVGNFFVEDQLILGWFCENLGNLSRGWCGWVSVGGILGWSCFGGVVAECRE